MPPHTMPSRRPIHDVEASWSQEESTNELMDCAEIALHSAEAHKPQLRLSERYGEASKLIFGAVGIYTAYLYYGHVQEDIFRYESLDGKKFKNAWFLQLLESIGNVTLAATFRHFFGGGKGFSLFHFYSSGTSQLFSKVLTSLALAAGLSFPVCTLAKCAKIVPVMVGQLVMGGDKYKIRDYIMATLIVSGTAILSLGESHKASNHQTTTSGVLLILLSLVCDGMTAGLQKRLISQTSHLPSPPTTYDFLLYTNAAMALSALVICLAIGDLTQGYAYLVENPSIAHMIIKVCVLSAIGQSFVFYIISNFCPQVCATITTTRKIMSVCWSIAMKGHVMSPQGGIGLGIAMAGLGMEVQHKVQKSRRKYKAKDSNVTGQVALVERHVVRPLSRTCIAK